MNKKVSTLSLPLCDYLTHKTKVLKNFKEFSNSLEN